MAKEKTVNVKVVPTQGEAQDKLATVPARGATVRSALEAVGTRTTNVDIQVNGKPASLDTKITAKSRIVVTERPQGS